VAELPVKWATATRTRPGERIAGDLAVVALAPAGALIAAADGLGHGPEAARAARVALREVLAAEGDVLIFATDGVDRGFADDLDVSGSAIDIAERVIRRHWRACDDAISVVARYLRKAP
jgi:hypothetical protein